MLGTNEYIFIAFVGGWILGSFFEHANFENIASQDRLIKIRDWVNTWEK